MDGQAISVRSAPMAAIDLLDFAGVAATGALAASRKELDAIGFLSSPR